MSLNPHRLLGPLADFTDMLSAENFVTMSVIQPVLHVLWSDVLMEAENDTQLTKDSKVRILTYLDPKYSDPDVSGMLNVSCFLGPRFTYEYISTGVEVAIVKDRLALEGVEMLELAAEPTATPTHSSIEQQQSDSEPPSKKRELGSWLKASKQQQDMSSTPKSPDTSTKAYFAKA